MPVTSNLQPLSFGTTGTGLDGLITLMGTDAGLNNRISAQDMAGGLSAADSLNGLIVAAARATGAANDGAVTTSDVYAINAWIRENHLELFTTLHGDDEDGEETGYHLLQNDGSFTRIYALNAVDQVIDSLYHVGFEIIDGRFVNEDGNANASVSDVAFWMNDLLDIELSGSLLINRAVDPQVHGSTGTGLDQLVELIVDDTGLNDRISQAQINAGATAANGMNQILVDGIRATGIADDGDLTALDMRDLNAWIRAKHGAEWTALHGDDEEGVETGFHLVQGDGATDYLYSTETVNTLADGLYHAGFSIQWDRFVNEDGNGNASLGDVATWLSLLLADDLADGALGSGRGPARPASFAGAIDLQLTRDVVANGDTGYREIAAKPALRDQNGTFTLRFTADTPDDGSYQVLFGKDGESNQAGDLTVILHDGEIYAAMQDGINTAWLKVPDLRIEAGTRYDLAVSFGKGGLEIYLNGEKVAVNDDFITGMEGNDRGLVVGASNWGQSAANPNAIWNIFDGRIEDFTYYGRALNSFEIRGLAESAPLDLAAPGAPVVTGDLPALREGTGLTGAVYDRSGSFADINDLLAQTLTQNTPTRNFVAHRVDFGATFGETTLGAFLDDAGHLTNGGGATDMSTIGMRLQGYVWIPEGAHMITVRSDDGFQLSLGGQVVSSYNWGRGFESTSRQIDFAGGLYQIDLYYFENIGDQGLRLELDGQTMGAQYFWRSVQGYQDALAEHGAAPEGGLPPVYDGPVGTTGTGLDQIIRVIGTDEGLQHNISHQHIRSGAAAADTINWLIVNAIRATGVANDGVITTTETYAISDHIRGTANAAFMAAHGDDEDGLETGYHLVQNDGATTLIFGHNAVNTVFDSIFHIGFDTIMDRFVNEDGNANARVEEVAYWLNELLADDLEAGTLANDALGVPGATGLLGSADAPDVVSSNAITSVLAADAKTLRLTGTSMNGMGNAQANTITGNSLGNLLYGANGDDALLGAKGNDVLIGGRGDDAIDGGEGDDALSGGVGDDALNGGIGADALRGGLGSDRFIFDKARVGVDRIEDFDAGEDHIVIDASGFGGGLRAGDLAGNRLVQSATPSATQNFGQFLYDRDDGRLYFDENGTGAGGVTLFAQLDGAPSIGASDFILLA